MFTPSSTIQRRDPLTSAPNKSVATTSTMLTVNTINANRRICAGDSIDVASRTTIAGTK